MMEAKRPRTKLSTVDGGFRDIPQELWMHVLDKLPAKEIMNIMQTSPALRLHLQHNMHESDTDIAKRLGMFKVERELLRQIKACPALHLYQPAFNVKRRHAMFCLEFRMLRKLRTAIAKWYLAADLSVAETLTQADRSTFNTHLRAQTLPSSGTYTSLQRSQWAVLKKVVDHVLTTTDEVSWTDLKVPPATGAANDTFMSFDIVNVPGFAKLQKKLFDLAITSCAETDWLAAFEMNVFNSRNCPLESTVEHMERNFPCMRWSFFSQEECELRRQLHRCTNHVEQRRLAEEIHDMRQAYLNEFIDEDEDEDENEAEDEAEAEIE
jgi:hypothetical protein